MTTEPMRPGRIAGLALLGVGAVAAVLGVVTLVGGGGEGEAAQPPATTAPPAATSAPEGTSPGAPTGAPTTTEAPTTAAPTTTTTVPVPAPTTTTTVAAPPPNPPAPSTKDQQVRVYNNSFVSGLAERATEDLRAAGWTVVDTQNYNGGNIPVTTVYFRPGTPEEAAAQQLGAELKIRVEPRFDGIEDSSPGLIVIVTREYSERGK